MNSTRQIEAYGIGRTGENISFSASIAPPDEKSGGVYPGMYFMDSAAMEEIADMPRGELEKLIGSKSFYGRLFERNMHMIAKEVQAQIEEKNQFRILTLPSLGVDLSFMGAMFKAFHTGTNKEVCFLKRKKGDTDILCIFPNDEVCKKAKGSLSFDEVSVEEATKFICSAVFDFVFSREDGQKRGA